jgi:uncharacterized protein YecE (DUF72 family)
MKLYAGASGYSYKEWKGWFYPEKIAPSEMLRFYAERLPAVEINNTFYRLPKASVLSSWAEQVPEDFRFALKASRRITHLKRLKAAESETEYLLRTASVLKERLGVILFQMPPYLKKDASRLEAFLNILPEGTPAAFEFRNDTWYDDEIKGLLRARDCALCITDGAGVGDTELIETARWGYIRMRKEDYSDEELAAWRNAVRGTGWEALFIFFKHEDDGAGPILAARFLEAAAAGEG